MISNVFDIIFLKILNFILRSRSLYVFCGIGVLKIFEKVTGKQQWSPSLIKLKYLGLQQYQKGTFSWEFSYEFCETFSNNLFTERWPLLHFSTLITTMLWEGKFLIWKFDGVHLQSIFNNVKDIVMLCVMWYHLYNLTLFRMGLFGTTHWWGGGGAKRPPSLTSPDICHTSYNDETWHSLPKEDPKNIWITWHTLWFLLTSAFFQQKSANYAISRSTDIDCILINNF